MMVSMVSSSDSGGDHPLQNNGHEGKLNVDGRATLVLIVVFVHDT